METDFVTTPVSYEEAAELIEQRVPLSRDLFDQLAPEMRTKAFTITMVEDLRLLEEIRDAIAEVPRGADWDAVKKEIAARLEATPWFNETAARRRAELLLRLHVFQAYSAAKWASLETPEARRAFPYLEYRSCADEAVRETHAALHGLTLRRDHPFWQDHWPPWEWNCRCDVVAVTHEEVYDIVREGRVAGDGSVLDAATRARGWTVAEGTQVGERLEKYSQVDWGSGQPVDARSPKAKATTPAEQDQAYQWHPSQVYMNLEMLKARYGERTVAQYVALLQQTEEGRELVEALKRGPAIMPAQDLPEGPAIAERKMTQRIIEVGKQIGGAKTEIFVLLGRDGIELVAPYVHSAAGGVLPSYLVKVLRDRHFIHNHPSGRFFSVDDLRCSADCGLASMAAATTSRVFIARPGPTGWPNPWQVEAEYDAATQEAEAVVDPLYYSGRLTHAQAEALFEKLFIQKLIARLPMIQFLTINLR